ncbi:pilus (MSHA type) biogenesis protein MshL [Motiliproteus coralliicola]|uniref:Pilus (MSHA type) biogenesis protein MshL n=1 Tax=Motiliproteus coralliicola TaxID=2283196 RepID=A0A369WCF5_9GAMM|nr:pilus (MSHA type) biogenesis protein MshL [Motiliproteus coralliicola]RDE18859.1 pilus (MSHA type) biogenesis protein MshL [Motiliproteus coralliicola]
MRGLTAGIVGIALVLSGCQSWQPTTGASAQQDGVLALEQALEDNRKLEAQLQTPPADVMQALLPPLQLQGFDDGEAVRFDLSAQNLDARSFFMDLVRDTPYNMVVSEGIGGRISLELKNVSVEEVMQTVREVYGYEYKRQGNLYQVIPARLETAMFQIDYLNVNRQGDSDIQVSAGAVSQSGEDNASERIVGTRINTKTSTNFWGQMQQTLSAIIGDGEGRSVVISPQAGMVVVKALPSELETVADYLQQAQLTLQRQVILEAKILEVRLSSGFQAGVDWQGVIRNSSESSGNITIGPSAETVTNPDNIDGVFGINFNFTDFNAMIELLERQGQVQVLSSPRVATLNNQKAVIKVGTDEFFVTDISTTTTTGTATTTTPDIELTPFFSGIALDVTPQLSDNGEIILHIHPSISEVNDQQKSIVVGTDTFQLPLAQSTIRESDSVVRASSGQVIVIGGLMQTVSDDRSAKTPVLGDIDGVGGLFRQENQGTQKSELVILLKPTIAGTEAWRNNLQQSLDNFNNLYHREGL